MLNLDGEASFERHEAVVTPVKSQTSNGHSNSKTGFKFPASLTSNNDSRRPRQLPSLGSNSGAEAVAKVASAGCTSPSHSISASMSTASGTWGPGGSNNSSVSSSPLGNAGASSLPTNTLAARRKFNLTTNPMEKLSVETKRGSVQCGIRKANFQAEYDIGDEVMPSCHRGMQVMNAIHRKTGHPVVVKIRFKRESFRTREEESEWRQSTEYMLTLPECSNIAQLYEVLEDEKAYFVCMEKVDGKDLFESISGQDLLPVEEVKEILAQILAGLAELHARGRIHKDLKLENVMLDRTFPSKVASTPTMGPLPTSPKSPLVKLIDFDTVEEYVPMTPKRTRDVLGTDQYIAQEAYDGNYSPASDVFAVGVIGYRLCAGKFPFKSNMFDDKPGENWVGSPKMKEIRGKLRNFKIKWSYRLFEQDPVCCDLIRSMLSTNECDRPSAVEALSNPWLSSTVAAATYFETGGNSPTRSRSRSWVSTDGKVTSPSRSSGRNSASEASSPGKRRFLPNCMDPA